MLPIPPTTVFVGEMVKGSPEQIFAVVFSISGVGLTVTVTRKGVPVQAVASLGVTRYSTICGVLVAFRRA